jgi:hypothetical protein
VLTLGLQASGRTYRGVCRQVRAPTATNDPQSCLRDKINASVGNSGYISEAHCVSRPSLGYIKWES